MTIHPDTDQIVLVQPHLERVGTVSVQLGEPLELGQTDTGTERIIPILGGTVSGPRLHGDVLPGGADWQRVRPDGTAVIDARYTMRLRASDGEARLVSLRTAGIRTGASHVLAALREGSRVDPADYYFRFAATATTASPEHAWLTTSVLVASAARLTDAVLYDLYRVS